MTVKITAMLLVLAASFSNSFAARFDPEFHVKLISAKNFAVYMTNVDTENTQVSIKDVNGYTFYSETVSGTPSYSRMFNLQQLPEGEYSLELENNRLIESFPLVVAKDGLSITQADKNVQYKPHLRDKDNVLDIMLFIPEKSRVDIDIFDSNSSLVYTETFKQKTTIEKQFDFSSLPVGAYKVKIEDRGRSFYYTMNVK